MWRRYRFVASLLLITVFCFPASAKRTPPVPVKNLSPEARFVETAERMFYYNDSDLTYDALEKFLLGRLKTHPKEAYTLWSLSRVYYFKKDQMFMKETTSEKRIDLKGEKLALAKKCHTYADLCVENHPDNAECHLTKGACYAAEASTIGASIMVLPKLKKLDRELEKAAQLPSTVTHLQGRATTAGMANLMRGGFYRLLPDNWLFHLIAGVRGDRKKAYEWLTSSIKGKLEDEHMFLLEIASLSLCRGHNEKNSQLLSEGFVWLDKAEKLPARIPMDYFDLKNVAYLKTHPQEACKYRRERFEDTVDTLSKLKQEEAVVEPTPISGK